MSTTNRCCIGRIRHRGYWAVTLLFALLVLANAQSWVAESQAADPDFSQVTDILGGRRYLLRDDDLIVTAAWLNAANTVQTSSVCNFPTTDSNRGSGAPVCNEFESGLAIPLVPQPIVTTVGRMFDLSSDVVATIYTGAIDGGPVQYSILANVFGTSSQLSGLTLDSAAQLITAAMADFNGDGYADLVVNSDGAMRIATAHDVNDFSAGIDWGPVTTDADAYSTMAVGDFNGDGWPDIAGAINVGSVVAFELRSVDPTTLTIREGVSVQLSIPGVSQVCEVSLTAGRFGTTAYDQLVLAYGPCGGSAGVASIDVDSSLNPTLRATLDLEVPPGDVGSDLVAARSGPLDWFRPLAQAAVLASGSSTAILSVLTFDQDLNITQSSRHDLPLGNAGCVYDMAVGNFDHMQANPTPPPPTQRDPNLQVALLWASNCTQDPPSIDIYDVNPQANFQLTKTSTNIYPTQAQNALQTAALGVGDLQGRALALGAPTKVTITSHRQPDLVLATPPMHIDWINPVQQLKPAQFPGCDQPPAPCQLNLTFLPSVLSGTAFSTQYTFSSAENSSAERKSTTSYGFSTKETTQTKISYGIPDIGGVSSDLKTSAEQTHDHTVATTYNTYTSVSNNLTATTGAADHLFFTESRFNVYYYPVLGQTVCPTTIPNCAEDQRLPLHIQFSGPDMVDQHDIDATTQEWYQPVHEPGNVFSYPWSPDQLQDSFPNFAALAGDPDQPNWRGTDSTTTTYTTTWSQGSGANQTSGSVSTYKTDVSVTASANASIEGFGIDGSAGFEVNTSQSVSTQNTSTQTLAASTGIQVNKPQFASVIADSFLYDFAGYVFGQKPPAETVQTIPLTDEQHNPIDIQGTGPLLVGFLADPLREGLLWWRQAYTMPDVGLNHPERWDWSPSTQTASFNFANANDPPQDQAFYHIKGFFITPQDANATGPQLTTATAGDQLQLQARVYNFSLTDMPVGTQVHVQFYAQGYKDAELNGDSFLIGEAKLLQPIPGFNSPSTNGTLPNWALVSTTFDTGAHPQTKDGNVNLIFWVLVWMQDAQGNVVAELPDHGLTSDFMPSTTFAQITQVPTESHSNNVGFYGYTGSGFYLAPPGSEVGGAPTHPEDLVIERLSVESPSAVPLDQKTKVTLSLRTGDTALGSLPVVFYDGEPGQGGRPFDIMHLSRLRPNETTLSRVFFRPQSCGTHTVVAVAGPATPAPATARAAVTVTLDTVAATDGLIKFTSGLALPEAEEQRLLSRLWVARRAFVHQHPRGVTVGLTSFIREVERQRGTTLTDPQADALSGRAQVILGCA
jgi:hypothetical protein